MVRQSDGKLVVAGSRLSGGAHKFALVRYNADGSLDTGFGTGGQVTTDFDGSDGGGATAVEIQPDGKLVVAGASYEGTTWMFALARYHSDGTLDTGFGAGGRVNTTFGSPVNAASDIAIQGDGKLVVVGTTESGGTSDFAVARYHADGTLDASFGDDGKVVTDLSGSADSALAVAIRGDKVVVAGVSTGYSTDFGLVRYNADGTLDGSFGTGGVVITEMDCCVDVAKAIAIQGDGKLVVAGAFYDPSGGNPDFGIARYHSDGSLDGSFGVGGKVRTEFAGQTDSSTWVMVQADGKIVAGGYSDSGASFGVALARYDAQGNLEVAYTGAPSDPLNAMLIEPDGKLVAVDWTGHVARYLVPAQAANHFGVEPLGSPTAGTAVNVTVTARDLYGNPDSGYSGTVHLTSSDGAALLPPDATLIGGTATVSVTFRTAGTQTVTATDTATALTGTSAEVNVAAAAATRFTVSAPANATAGTAVAAQVTAWDAFDNVATGYGGVVHLTATGGNALLPPDGMLSNGAGTFPVTFRTAGIQRLTATDTVNGSLTGSSGDIDVAAGAVNRFTVSAPANATAGTAVAAQVTAWDAFDNVATGYGGVVHLTATGGSALLPPDGTLSDGTGIFPVTFRAAGIRRLTATDTVIGTVNGTSGDIHVTAGPAARFVVTAPATATAGAAVNVTVTAVDSEGNTGTDYSGTVHLASSDADAILPGDGTLTAGTGTFVVTLRSVGIQTVTVTDTATGSLTGASDVNVVSAAPVPVLAPFALGALGLALAGAGARRVRCRR